MRQVQLIRELAPGDWQIEVAPGQEYVCDFCSSTPVVMSFATAPEAVITMPDKGGVGFRDESDWAACEECAKLVMAEDQPALTRRSAETYFSNAFMRPSEGFLKMVEREFTPLHVQFFHARQRAKDDAVGTTERRAP